MLDILLLMLVIAVLASYVFTTADEMSNGIVTDLVELLLFWPFHLLSTVVWVVWMVFRRADAVVGVSEPAKTGATTGTGTTGVHHMHPAIQIGVFVVTLGVVLSGVVSMRIGPGLFSTVVVVGICVGIVIVSLYSYREWLEAAVRDSER